MFALTCAVLSLSAQRSHLELGDDYFRKRFYREAIAEYQLALQEKVVVKKYYMTERVAKTYRMLFDYENAVIWYTKLMEFKDENALENIFYLALLQMNLEQYDQARITFMEYVKRNSSTDNPFNDWCSFAQSMKDSIRKYSVYKTSIETGSRSMGLAYFKEGLVYAHPQIKDFTVHTSFYDLAYLKANDSIQFAAPEILVGQLNKSFYEGTPCFSADQKTLYYSGNSTTVTKYRKKKNSASFSKEGVNILKIFKSEWVNNAWSLPVELNFNSNEYDCVFPSLSADGKTIYFASNMPGGKGGFDIYRSEMDENGQWKTPQNLGELVNSPWDEMYPYVLGDSLFFSSKGKVGFGGADIFVAQLKEKQVLSVSNMGKPFNSPKDDFSFIAKWNNQLMEGYFSSNREGNSGYDYVYFFREHPKPLLPDTISGIAMNKITLQPLKGVKIKLIRKDSIPELTAQFVTDKSGEVELILDKNVPYEVSFELEGFQKKVVEIPADKREDAIAKFGDLQMEPEIKKNTVIKIPNIYFDFDKATLRPESFNVLAQIIQFLNDNPTIRVELSAHTDARGNDAYNMKLSQKRAESTVRYLVEHGIPASRLVPKGYGETKIQNQCKNGVKCSEEEHEFNRRVEMKVL